MPPSPIATGLDGYEVWFVTGSQILYGEETLRQVAEQSQQVAQGLQGLPVRVVWRRCSPTRTASAGSRSRRTPATR